MLSDRDVEEIERGRKQKLGGPLVLTWVDKLLEDRRERIEQLEHLRKRLDQAFRYLDGLVREARHPPSRPSRPTAAPGSTQPGRPLCPRCGKPYESAAGQSPRGVVYTHSGGTQCT